MTRVLVTGGAGFIGRHALASLAGLGLEVHAVSRRQGADFGPAVRWHRADLLERAAARELIEAVRPTHLLHLAWCAEPGTFWGDHANLDWVAASLELARAFRDCGGERFVGAGTCAEVDRVTGGSSEPSQLAGTVYGTCKRSAGAICEAFFRPEQVAFAWGRVFFVYGPHEHPARLVPSVARSLLAGQLALCTPGLQERDFLHVADLADAFVRLLLSGVEGALDLGSGRATAVKDVVLTLADRLGARDRVRLGAYPAPTAEPARLVADVRRLEDELAWKPRIDLASGLGQTLDWWHDRLASGTREETP